MKICIDAGHYNKYNPGVANGYFEGNAMWELSLLLKAELEKYGVEIIMTRDNVTADKSLYDRGKMGANSDLFLSLHSNAATPDARGTEIYYSVFRDSKAVADKIGSAIVSTMKPDLPNTLYRGSKTRKYSAFQNKDYYGVLRAAVGETGKEAVKHALLIEHGFHTNPDECRWLTYTDNLKKLAVVEADVIAKHFGLKIPTDDSIAERLKLAEQTIASLEGEIADCIAVNTELKTVLEKIRELAG
jgi:N-acetylmuramoyl-L-alanine amidase